MEKADRKLFLDAAVIQQGRLAEQFKSVDKKDLMTMVTFGADQILSSKGGTYTDEDIDALIAKGEEKTSAIQAKLMTDAKHNLANFSLLGDDAPDTFMFDGKNYREESRSTGNLINLPQRERKRNYDVNDYFKEQFGTVTTSDAVKKKRKGPAIYDFQLFDLPRLTALNEKETDLSLKKQEQLNLIRELRLKAKNSPSIHNARARVEYAESIEGISAQIDQIQNNLYRFELSIEDQQEKERLMAEGFQDWYVFSSPFFDFKHSLTYN